MRYCGKLGVVDCKKRSLVLPIIEKWSINWAIGARKKIYEE